MFHLMRNQTKLNPNFESVEDQQCFSLTSVTDLANSMQFITCNLHCIDCPGLLDYQPQRLWPLNCTGCVKTSIIPHVCFHCGLAWLPLAVEMAGGIINSWQASLRVTALGTLPTGHIQRSDSFVWVESFGNSQHTGSCGSSHLATGRTDSCG